MFGRDSGGCTVYVPTTIYYDSTHVKAQIYATSPTLIGGDYVTFVKNYGPTVSITVNGNGNYSTSHTFSFSVVDSGVGLDLTTYPIKYYFLSPSYSDDPDIVTAFYGNFMFDGISGGTLFSSDGTGTVTLSTTPDGPYRLYIRGMNALGEPTYAVSELVRFDNTPPRDVTFSPNGSTYVGTPINVTITGNDNNGGSGCANSSFDYKITTETSTPSSGYTTTTFGNDGTKTISFGGPGYSGTYYIYVKNLCDAVGNCKTEVTHFTTSNPFYFDFDGPTIEISFSPENESTWTKTKSVTITCSDTGDSGLSSSNSYQYYLSTSNSTPTNGTWTNYTNGTAITNLGSGLSGTYYLWVKSVQDNVGNFSNSGNDTCYGTALKFDNTAPTGVTYSPNNYSWRNSAISVTITGNDGSAGCGNASFDYIFTTETTAPSSGYTTTTFENDGTKQISFGGGDYTGTYYIYVKNIHDSAGNEQTESTKSGEYKFDNTAPTIDIAFSPANQSTWTKTKSVTITCSDTGGSGLNSGNVYEYALSTSNSTAPGSGWTNYTNNTQFTAGSGLNGTYYLWINKVLDTAGNRMTNASWTEVGDYNVYTTGLKFDNTANTYTIVASTRPGTPINGWIQYVDITITINDDGCSPIAVSEYHETPTNTRSGFKLDLD